MSIVAQSVGDLTRSTIISTGKIEEYKLLRDFFETLANESESNYYSSFMSRRPSEYVYVL